MYLILKHVLAHSLLVFFHPPCPRTMRVLRRADWSGSLSFMQYPVSLVWEYSWYVILISLDKQQNHVDPPSLPLVWL